MLDQIGNQNVGFLTTQLKSVPEVTVKHHSASLMMQNNDLLDNFVFPYLTFVSDSDNLINFGDKQPCVYCVLLPVDGNEWR